MNLTLDEITNNITSLIDEFFNIRADESKIFRMHEIAEDLSKNSLYLSYHYLAQQRIFAAAKIAHDINVSKRKLELMDMSSYKNKKMTATYATMTAEEEYIQYKKDYVLADAEKEGINSILFQVKENLTSIRQRIASIKNNNI